MNDISDILQKKLIELNKISVRLFGVCILDLKIATDLTGTRAGVINTSSKVIRLNRELIKKYPEFIVGEVLPHEVAHFISKKLYPNSKPHGVEWKTVASILGLTNPKATHSMPVQKVRNYNRIGYYCKCSHHLLTLTRHNKIINGQAEYYCKKCKERLRKIGKEEEKVHSGS